MKRPLAREKLFAATTPQTRSEYNLAVAEVTSLLMRIAGCNDGTRVRDLLGVFTADVARQSSLP